MFETAELGRTLAKDEYKERVPQLRTRLLEVQRQLDAAASFPVIILVNGAEGAGKGETLALLNEWLDARYVVTSAFGEPTEEQQHRPPYWRYWMALPPKSRIGVIFNNWYTRPIINRVYGLSDDDTLDAELARVNDFERSLVDDGALMIKLWLHISKQQQRERFKSLESDKQTAWRVTKRDWKHHELYDDFRRVCTRALRETSTGEAPWLVIESSDDRYRNVTVAEHVINRIADRLDQRPRSSVAPPSAIDDPHTILDTLDLSGSISKSDYKKRLEKAQGKLNKLARKAAARDVSTIMVFEGLDAAGKGGAIRRLIHALDARQYRVIPIAAPSDEEKAQHYLWRFWRQLPRKGRFTIYDRSWYGRVLVERVEGFARPPEWQRAYKEINDFEEQLVQHGVVLCKFWLHISPEEQLRRFEERKNTPWKRHKITDEDYRNRDKWNLYEEAAAEMVGRTSTEYCPWTLVEAENKHLGRLKVIDTVVARLDDALKRKKNEK